MTKSKSVEASSSAHGRGDGAARSFANTVSVRVRMTIMSNPSEAYM